MRSGGPGDEAGVLPGDTLIALEGYPLNEGVPDSVWSALQAGTPVHITVRRGEVVTITIVPGAVPF